MPVCACCVLDPATGKWWAVSWPPKATGSASQQTEKSSWRSCRAHWSRSGAHLLHRPLHSLTWCWLIATCRRWRDQKPSGEDQHTSGRFAITSQRRLLLVPLGLLVLFFFSLFKNSVGLRITASNSYGCTKSNPSYVFYSYWSFYFLGQPCKHQIFIFSSWTFFF